MASSFVEFAVQILTKAYLETSHTSKMELLRKKLSKFSAKKARYLTGVQICRLLQKSAKMQLLNKLSEILLKCISLIVFQNSCFKSGYFLQQTNFKFQTPPTEDFFMHSRSQVFFKIGVPKNFEKFSGKHLCWCLFLIKLQALGLQLY